MRVVVLLLLFCCDIEGATLNRRFPRGALLYEETTTTDIPPLTTCKHVEEEPRWNVAKMSSDEVQGLMSHIKSTLNFLSLRYSHPDPPATQFTPYVIFSRKKLN